MEENRKEEEICKSMTNFSGRGSLFFLYNPQKSGGAAYKRIDRGTGEKWSGAEGM